MDAETYLARVVSGEAIPDQVRVQAAKALLAYQKPKQRGKMPSPTPRKMAENEARAEDQAVVTDFEKKAAEIRKRHAERGPQ